MLNSEFNLKRPEIFQLLKRENIEHRIITCGNFLRHKVIEFFDYECVGDIINANIIHDQGFFVGNQPRDLRKEIERLHQILTSGV